jgi:hypothetical protein
MSKINTNNNTKTAKTFSKKSQVAIICGELANTYYEVNSATQDMPIILTDTQKVETAKVLKNNFTILQISDSGTGADPAVGRELAKSKLEQVKELTEDYDTINVFYGVGGGTSGSALEIGDYLKSIGKLVIMHPMGLIATDSCSGNRIANLEYSTKAISGHNHCWIRPLESTTLKEIAAMLKNRIEDLVAISNFRNFDNNDYLGLFQSSEFVIYKGTDPMIAKTQLNKFLSENISSFFVGQSSEEGSLVGANMLQLVLRNHLKENGKSKVAPRFGSSELLAVLCR